MFSIIRDSIFYPKGLMKQVNRSGWFIFLYIIVLTLFMSLGPIVGFLTYDKTTFTTESTGCSIDNYTLVCDGDNYDVNSIYTIYDMRVFFLGEDMTIADIEDMGDTSIVVQGSGFSLYFGDSVVTQEDIFTPRFSTSTLEAGMQTLQTLILVSWIVYTILSNIFLVVVIILISTLMFIRYKPFIKYKKIFKLLTLGVTPVILSITLYNILGIGPELFFILGFVAYIPLFRLNKELYAEIALRQLEAQAKAQKPKDDNVVETYDYDDIDARDVDDSEEDKDE